MSGYPLHLFPFHVLDLWFFSVRPNNGQYWGSSNAQHGPPWLVRLYALARRPPAPPSPPTITTVTPLRLSAKSKSPTK